MNLTAPRQSGAYQVIRRPINDFKISSACAPEIAGVVSSGNWRRVCNPWPPYHGDVRKYNSASTVTDLYTFPSTGITDGTITKVTIWMLILTTEGNSGSKGHGHTAISYGGTSYYGAAAESFRTQKNYDGTNYTARLNFARPSWRKTEYVLHPSGSGSWTWDEVNAIVAGVQLTGATNYALVAVYEVKATIDFITSSGVAKTITIRPNGDSSAACTTNDNTNMAYTFLDGETASAGRYIECASTSYKEVLSGILPIPDNAIPSKVTIIHTALKSSNSYTGNSKPVLRTHGTEYYGTEQSLVYNSWTEYADEWTTNPATSQAWTREEVNSLNFGIALKTSNASGKSRCNQVYLKVDFTLALPSYFKLNGSMERLTQYKQNPIHADDMVFRCEKNSPIPNYGQIVFSHDGKHVFQGFIIRKEDKGNYYLVTCKSQQWILSYRYIPNFTYQADFRNAGIYSKTKLYASYRYPPQSNMDLNGVLSSDPPQWCDDTVYYDSDRIQTYCSIGLLTWINGCVPGGNWEAYSATVAMLEGAGQLSGLRDKNLYACTTYPRTGQGSTDVDNYNIDGIKRLRQAVNLAGIADNEYWREAEDLYIKFGDGSYLPNAFLVLAYNWVDTRIRRGNIENGDILRIGVDFNLEGEAAKKLDEFFGRIGKEIAFPPGGDGFVYLNAADELSRGSAAIPVKKFQDGLDDCRVKIITPQEPEIQAVIGLGGQSNAGQTVQVAANWQLQEPALFKIYKKADESNEELRATLEDMLDDQDITLTIETPHIDYHIEVGDWIWATPEDAGYYALRINKKDITGQKMTLTAGKASKSAGQIFGEYLKYQIPSGALPIQTSVLGGDSGSFIIRKESAMLDNGLVVYFEGNYSGPDDDSPLAMGAFIEISLNGAVIPPGRVLINPGSIKVDLTDYVNKSTSEDTTNTIAIAIYLGDGWTNDGAYVKQYNAKQNLVAET